MLSQTLDLFAIKESENNASLDFTARVILAVDQIIISSLPFEILAFQGSTYVLLGIAVIAIILLAVFRLLIPLIIVGIIIAAILIIAFGGIPIPTVAQH